MKVPGQLGGHHGKLWAKRLGVHLSSDINPGFWGQFVHSFISSTDHILIKCLLALVPEHSRAQFLPSGEQGTDVEQILPHVNVFTIHDKCAKRQALVENTTWGEWGSGRASLMLK